MSPLPTPQNYKSAKHSEYHSNISTCKVEQLSVHHPESHCSDAQRMEKFTIRTYFFSQIIVVQIFCANFAVIMATLHDGNIIMNKNLP